MARNNRDFGSVAAVPCGNFVGAASCGFAAFVGFVDSTSAGCWSDSARSHSLPFVEFPARVGCCALLRFAIVVVAPVALVVAAGDGNSAPQSRAVLQFG